MPAYIIVWIGKLAFMSVLYKMYKCTVVALEVYEGDLRPSLLKMEHEDDDDSLMHFDFWVLILNSIKSRLLSSWSVYFHE